MPDRRLIEQLESSEPDKRKAAIQQLARSKDMDAIRYLEAVERLDTDSAVRDLARKAIAYIERQNEGAAASAEAEAPAAPAAPAKSRYAAGSIMAEYESMKAAAEEEAPPVASGDQPTLVEVSEARRKNAKGALDMAGRAAFEEMNGRATKYLIEAFKLNPNLKYDSYAVGLAATVTGLYKTDAIKAIMDGSALELFDKKELQAKPKRKTDEDDEEEDRTPAGWNTALVDLLIYGLINAVIVGVTVIVLMNLIIQSVQAAAANDPEFQASLAASGLPATAVVSALSDVAIPLMIVYALLYGFLSIIGLLISSSLIHVAARTILGGDGTLANLIHRTAIYLGVMAALVTIAQIAGFFLPVIADPFIGIAIWAAAFGLSIWTLIGYASRIGKAYDMGTGKGCAAILLSIVLLVVLGVVCFGLLGQAVFTQLNDALVLQATQGGGIFQITPTVAP